MTPEQSEVAKACAVIVGQFDQVAQAHLGVVLAIFAQIFILVRTWLNSRVIANNTTAMRNMINHS